ncbi:MULTISPECIES: iron-containing alcohol dehydrogenase [Chryseobacterium]|uniref:NADP-dependent alcohol dehydrogenase n=1 Tax=Chryseobacterium camelliae TaxID=1265445 RepID=A0ABU0TFH7_9FLAO|nr:MULTISPECIES: iron-containing alcohol dehydrogenase [Chryseobacterium]MDT3406481.1 NADP-dependent alcohol dehydrogenase [Pseudacidovorax intermedius]MDQ1095721.1 NADP-dependent alcohol dehydrogenase [Chryseobacterium camelliae]MDQ1099657.1 NADP-dependent alcohol dehydrogenase [Chryseobacterium sp. SORGH_AS_1048]MDR6087006.1 NADP-dependent alcohol dehydrogenase [Chryseobacterium sp. SORGH_AS_0909]MDR6131378.1 NADP-dependent alcohol dehydrogenase [Chryseobacterium sp. SORGH_AS_1175]
MLNFEFKNPTKILFGKGEIAKIEKEIPEGAKILMIYGGGSIKNNGVYDQVRKALADFEFYEFGGVPANPEYEVLINALTFIKEKNINYLLAVGGGSVIDGTKFLSAAAQYEGEPWEILKKPVRTFEGQGMPFGTILTLPATGSEMNSGYVISRRETNEKLSSGGPGLFPQFSVLDPEVVRSIPKNQIANGITDAYTHVLEQYMTAPSSADLQERIAESILISLQQTAPKVMEEDFDYDAAGNFMWCCTMALNGLIQKGVITDWAVHAMGHELTAYYGIDHARTLAIIAPSHYRYNFETKKEKLAQYAERVWNITEGSVEEKAEAGIRKMEDFFHSLHIQTRLSDYVEDYQNTAERVKKAFTERNWLGLGEYKALSPEDAYQIVEMSY